MTQEIKPLTLNVRYNDKGFPDIARLMIDLEVSLEGFVRVTDWVDADYVTATYTNASFDEVKEIIASIEDDVLTDSVNTDLKWSAVVDAAGRCDIEIPETDEEPETTGPKL